MADAITIRPQPGDMAKLAEYMRRLRDELHLSEEKSVMYAANWVLRSLAAGTRKAPKRRKLLPNPGKASRAGKDLQFNSARFPYRVEVWGRDGVADWVYIPRGETRTHKAIPIKRAGLAASSWRWMLPEIGQAMGSTLVKPMAGVTSVAVVKGSDPSVTMTNRLDYIERAVRLGGKGDIGAAFGRAADAGFKYLAKRAERAAARDR